MAPPVALSDSKRFSLRPRDPFSRLLTSLHLISHLKASPGGVDAPLSTTNGPNQSGSFPPEQVYRSFHIGPGAACEHLVDPIRHLQLLLPDSCELLEFGTLEVVGGHPIDAGSVADVLVGKMGDRKVAIKVYRCYSSSSCSATCMVSGIYLRRVPLTKGPSAEALQRGSGV